MYTVALLLSLSLVVVPSGAQVLPSTDIAEIIPADTRCGISAIDSVNCATGTIPGCNFNGQCNPGETTQSCAYDCASCDADNVCEAGETPQNCAQDCPQCNNDDKCDWSSGETRANCAADCGFCNFNGICDDGETGDRCGDCFPSVSESFLFTYSCQGSLDCTAASTCGDTLGPAQRGAVAQAITNFVSGTQVAYVATGCTFAGNPANEATVEITVTIPSSTSAATVLGIVSNLVPAPGSNVDVLLQIPNHTLTRIARKNAVVFQSQAALRVALGLTTEDRLTLTTTFISQASQGAWQGPIVRPVGTVSAGVIRPMNDASLPVVGTWRAVFQHSAAQHTLVQTIRTQLLDKQTAEGIAQDVSRFASLSAVGLDGLTFSANSKVVDEVAMLSVVKYVERVPGVVLQNLQTGLTAEFGGNFDRLDQDDAPLNTQFNYFYQGRGVDIYVVDNGVDVAHTQFANNGGRGINGFSATGNFDVDGEHGTAVAGLAAGQTWGIAKRATVINVQVITPNNAVTRVESGLNWVLLDQGGRVAPRNRAVLTVGFQPAWRDLTLSWYFQKLSTAFGISTVMPTGNNDAWSCTSGNNRLATTTYVPGIVSVGSMNHRTDQESSFSVWGQCVTILAPGESVVAPVETSTTALQRVSGTSYAAGAVVGVLATYLQAYPLATPTELHDRLVALATDRISTKPGKTVDAQLRSGTVARLVNTRAPGNAVPPVPPPYNTQCGNGVIDAGESCDSGTRDSGNGCGTNCQVEAGFSCSNEPSVCVPTCPCRFETNQRNLCYNVDEQTCGEYLSGGTCPIGTRECATCGDGVKASTELCDTGLAQLACSSCQTQPGYVCIGGTTSPSTCAARYSPTATVGSNTATITIGASTTAYPASFTCTAFATPTPTSLPSTADITGSPRAVSNVCQTQAGCDLQIAGLLSGTAYDLYCLIQGAGQASIQPRTVSGLAVTTPATTISSIPVVGSSSANNILVRLQTAASSVVTCATFGSSTVTVTAAQVLAEPSAQSRTCTSNTNCDFNFEGLTAGQTVKVFCVPVTGADSSVSPPGGLLASASSLCPCTLALNNQNLCFNPTSNTCDAYVNGQCPSGTTECSTCGDGIDGVGEGCDIGSTSSAACDNCVVQPGFRCSATPPAASTCRPDYSFIANSTLLNSNTVVLSITSTAAETRRFTCALFPPPPPTTRPSAAAIRTASIMASSSQCSSGTGSTCTVTFAGVSAGVTYSTYCALDGSGDDGVAPTSGALSVSTPAATFAGSNSISLLSVVPAQNNLASATLSVTTTATTDVTCAAFPPGTSTPPPAQIISSASRGTSSCSGTQDCQVTITNLQPDASVTFFCTTAGSTISSPAAGLTASLTTSTAPSSGGTVLVPASPSAVIPSSGTPATPSSNTDGDDDNVSGVIAAAVGGGVGGLVIVLVILGLVLFFCLRKPSKHEEPWVDYGFGEGDGPPTVFAAIPVTPTGEFAMIPV